MDNWAEREAEKILDAFLAYKRLDDLVLLQHEVVAALGLAQKMGCLDTALDTHTGPRRLPQYLRR